MKFSNMKKSLPLVLLATTFIGCAQAPEEDPLLLMSDPFVAPAKGDGGIVMLEGSVTGEAAAKSVTLGTSDCEGSGYGVGFSGVQGQNNYLFDKNGQPCERADVMFDGSTPVGKRAADPNVADIAFVDQYGTQPQMPKAAQMPMPSEVDLPFKPMPEQMAGYGEYSMERKPLKVEDGSTGLESTINKWRHDVDRAEIVKDAEVLLAGVRDIDRMNDQELMRAHQERLVQMESRMRALEKENAMLKDYGNKLVVDINQTHSVSQADKTAQMHREQELQKDLVQMAQRAQEVQQINQALRSEFVENENAYKERIEELSSDLRSAERQADSSRQQMVLEAAKKIAEAEYLAQEANVAKRLSMQRRAQRLNLEAGDLLTQAEDMANGQPIVLPAFSGIQNLPTFKVVGEVEAVEMAKKPSPKALDTAKVEESAPSSKETLYDMETLVVHLKEEDQPLSEVFESVFDDIADRAGAWEVVWKLQPQNVGIAKEKWTVIAEAPLNQFLAYVAGKVEQEKGVQLSFQRFNGSHLFVISDR